MSLRRAASAAVLLAGAVATCVTTPGHAVEPQPVRYLLTTNGALGLDPQALVDAGAHIEYAFQRVYPGVIVVAPEGARDLLAAIPTVTGVAGDSAVEISAQQPLPWGVDRIDQDGLPLDRTYAPEGSGSGTRVYVVDTGVAPHGDFLDRLAPGWAATPDSLGTGDCNGHGTAMAGVAAGRRLGVARSATVVPVRVMPCSGPGSALDVMKGLDWIEASNAGVRSVVLLGLSGPGYSPLDTAVRHVVSAGLPVVVAAGNHARDACDYSPGRVGEAVTVSASTNTDTRAFYADAGACVDVFAPGSTITAPTIGAIDAVGQQTGTSMAAAHVAGALAVLLGRDRASTGSIAVRELVSTAVRGAITGVPAGTTDRLVHLGSRPQEPTPTPAAPQEVTATIQPGGVLISWQAPPQPVLGYRIGVVQDGTVLGSYTLDAGTTTVLIPLAAGAGYSVSVFATGQTGESAAGSSRPFTVR